MPIDENKIYRPNLEFRYEGELYKFHDFLIANEKGEIICRVDLTATEYSHSDTVYLIACKTALAAYYRGIEDGKEAMQNGIRNLLGLH